MKKLLVVMLSALMVFAMCGCGAKEESSDSGVVNPVHECTAEELLEVTGMDLAAPEGAENAACAYIDVENEEPIAQLTFTLDGKEYCYRAQSTGITSIMSNVDGTELSMDKIQEAMNEGTQIGAALSGLNYKWDCFATVDVQYCDGICAFNEGDAGFITWLDVAPGILYSLGMDDDCTQDLLMDTAADIFVPVQGNAG